jgi:NADH-quinone oxidoreductase subunit L
MIIAFVVYGRARIPHISAKVSSAPEGSKADWTFFFDYIHEIFITVTKAAAFIADMIVEKILQGIQWTVGSIAEIVGDGVSTFQVRKVRVQLTLSLLGVATLVVVVLLTGGLF